MKYEKNEILNLLKKINVHLLITIIIVRHIPQGLYSKAIKVIIAETDPSLPI